MAFITKILLMLPASLVSIFAIAQGIIKLVKEILSSALTILVPLFPKTQEFILKLREWINTIDLWVEKIKQILLGIIGVKDK